MIGKREHVTQIYNLNDEKTKISTENICLLCRQLGHLSRFRNNHILSIWNIYTNRRCFGGFLDKFHHRSLSMCVRNVFRARILFFLHRVIFCRFSVFFVCFEPFILETLVSALINMLKTHFHLASFWQFIISHNALWIHFIIVINTVDRGACAQQSNKN